MTQCNIAVSEEAFEKFLALKAKKNESVLALSNARLISYLVEMNNTIETGFRQAVEAESAKDGYEILKDAVRQALGYIPPVIPRGGYKRSRNATVEQRAYVTQQIITRLNVPNPPRELVNYYLNNGFDGTSIRAAVLNNQHLQGSPAPDTQAQP